MFHFQFSFPWSEAVTSPEERVLVGVVLWRVQGVHVFLCLCISLSIHSLLIFFYLPRVEHIRPAAPSEDVQFEYHHPLILSVYPLILHEFLYISMFMWYEHTVALLMSQSFLIIIPGCVVRADSATVVFRSVCDPRSRCVLCAEPLWTNGEKTLTWTL